MNIDGICPRRLVGIIFVSIPHQGKTINRAGIPVYIEGNVGGHNPVLVAPPHQLGICIQQGCTFPDIDYKGIGSSDGDAGGSTRNIP